MGTKIYLSKEEYEKDMRSGYSLYNAEIKPKNEKLDVTVKCLEKIELLKILNLLDKAKIELVFKLSHEALARIKDGKTSSDYENYDNLAFEPKMTWEELKEFASKEDTYRENNQGDMFCIFNDLYFYKNGAVQTYNYYVSEYRSYDQMKVVIENLLDEVK
ncbi:MAG: hypothetical protein NC124_02590 [Clostridium sp.]|nr:hypothetical protein [Clostridium sp.]